MTKKEQLYYMLKAYKRGEYDVKTFCSAFDEIYYPDIPKNELSKTEFEIFDRLAKIVARYSPFEEDIKNYPNAYYTDNDVKEAIEEALLFTDDTNCKLIQSKLPNVRVKLMKRDYLGIIIGMGIFLGVITFLITIFILPLKSALAASIFATVLGSMIFYILMSQTAKGIAKRYRNVDAAIEEVWQMEMVRCV